MSSEPAMAQSSSLQTRLANAVSRRESTAQNLIDDLTEYQNSSNSDESYVSGNGVPYTYTKGLGSQTSNNFLEYLSAEDIDDAIDNANWSNITLEGQRKQVSPNSSQTFLTEGMDPWLGTMPAAPSATVSTTGYEMLDNYWMAYHRDTPFEDYPNVPDASSLDADYNGVNWWFDTSSNGLYRGPFHTSTGPYLSQFLLQDVSFGALKIEPKIDPIPAGASSAQDFGRSTSAWTDLIEGVILGGEPGPQSVMTTSSTRRYISNGRNLAIYVQADPSYYHYLSAALALLPHVDGNNDIEFDNGLPFVNSNTVFPYIDHGGAALLDLVARTARNALVAAWNQKWRIHRRIRPETMGGRVHDIKTGSLSGILSPDSNLLNSNILDILDPYGNGPYYLPLAYPEGAPTHPSYPSGHSTIAGAGITVLKTFFQDGNLPGPLYKSQAGGQRTTYTDGNLSVYDELDKLVSNIGLGRIWAGVHYISDHYYGAKLGEQIALATMIDAFGDTEGNGTPQFRPLGKTTEEPVNVSTLETLRSENTSKNPDITV